MAPASVTRPASLFFGTRARVFWHACPGFLARVPGFLACVPGCHAFAASLVLNGRRRITARSNGSIHRVIMTKQVVARAGRWLLSLGVLACCALPISPATAQVTPEMRALYDRIDRLQRDLTGVQQQLYSTRPVNGVVGGGPIGGPAGGIAAAGDPALAAQFDV